MRGGGAARRILCAVAIVAAAVAYAFADRETGISTWLQLRGEVLAARAGAVAQRERIEALRVEARALERDPFAIERAIREDLGLARPGEVIVRLPRADPTSP